MSCNKQSTRIEKEVMKCVSIGFTDKREQFKELLLDYEALLIKESLIKDNTKESYIAALKQLASDPDNLNSPSYSFGKKLRTIDRKHTNDSKTCLQKVV